MPILNPIVVIDKSWLVGVSRGEAQDVANKYRFIMPFMLIYELLTNEKIDQQKDCFRKLSMIESSISFIEGLSSLLQFECAQQRQCTPIIDRCNAHSISFHPSLKHGQYPFSKEQLADLSREKYSREVKALNLVKKAWAIGDDWFPELRSIPMGGPPESIYFLLQRVAYDHDLVRSIYKQVASEVPLPNIPPAGNLDEKWAYFRWMQVSLFSAIEYIRRYGIGNEKIESKKLPNFYLDQQYLIIGTLAGGLASRDKDMIKFFRLLRPDGVLIQ